jgi:hypothetical protein
LPHRILALQSIEREGEIKALLAAGEVQSKYKPWDAWKAVIKQNGAGVHW